MNDPAFGTASDPDLHGETPIGMGTTVVVVRDTLLASALIAVGIPLRKDPPYTHIRLANGQEQWNFNFHPVDREGRITAKECIEAWQKDVAWCKQHPSHPFAFAMTAVKNFAQIREHQSVNRPFHLYRMPPDATGHTPTLWVVAGSRKEGLAVERGYERL